jgi:urease accessory protein
MASMSQPTIALQGNISTWHASLAIDLQGSEKPHEALGTRLMGVKHKGPLYVQKPFYPEGRQHPHLYLLHPPGGLVSGDNLTIDIQARNAAGALITTPGAAKAYRARSDQSLQSQQVNLSLSGGSCLEWFPQESIVYSGANTQMDMQLSLSRDSSYIGWEILCLGLPSSNAPFEQGQVNLRLQIFENESVAQACADPASTGQSSTVQVDTGQSNTGQSNTGQNHLNKNRLIYRDNLNVQAGDLLLRSRCGFNQCPVSAYLVAKFPANKVQAMEGMLEQMRARLTELNADKLVAITTMESLCVSRYLGHTTSEAKALFIALWKVIRPVLLNREAQLPRIWHT